MTITPSALWAQPAESILEIASACTVREHFEWEVLSLLSTAMGCDCAFFAKTGCLAQALPRRRQGLVARGYDDAQLHLIEQRAAVFDEELKPVTREAAKHRGVAVDTAVLGQSAQRLCYYRELVAPRGGGHSMLCSLEAHGQMFGRLVLGRRGRGFRDSEVDWMRRANPALGVSLASFYKPPRNIADCLPAQLTPRETEIASYLCLGYTNGEIAGVLRLSPNTVRNLLHKLFKKVGATTRAELVGLLLGS